MGKVFDATLKRMMAESPGDWLRILGRTAGDVEVIDTDLSGISAAADKVILVKDSSPWILHWENQASWDADFPERLHWYNSLVRHRHRLPVRTVLMLLRKQANSPRYSGVYQDTVRDETEPNVVFRYDVVRLWKISPETILAGGLWTLPLAPLTDVPQSAIGGVIEKLRPRFDQAPSKVSKSLWLSTYFLLGLRMSREEAKLFFQGIEGMKESSTYQAVLEEGIQQGREEGREKGREEGREVGWEEEAKRLLLKLGRRRFGEPDERTVAIIDSLDDLERLEQVVDRLMDVENWSQLMAFIEQSFPNEG